MERRENPPQFFHEVHWCSTEDDWREHQLDVSADASLIVYTKYSSPGAKPKRDGVLSVFAARREPKSIRDISVVPPARGNSNHSFFPSVSRDGRVAAFLTWEPSVVEDSGSKPPIVVACDLLKFGEAEGSLPHWPRRFGASNFVSVTGDGHRVLYVRSTSAPGAYTGQTGLYAFDRQANENGPVFPLDPSLARGVEEARSTPDGKHSVLLVRGYRPCAGDAGSSIQVTRQTAGSDELLVVTRGADGACLLGDYYGCRISDDGRTIAFISEGLIGGQQDLDWASRALVWQESVPGLRPVPLAAPSGVTRSKVRSVSMSSDGNRLALVCEFWSGAQDQPNSHWSRTDVVFTEISTGASRILSRSLSGEWSNGSSANAAISADGTTVAFMSYASDMTPEGCPGGPSVFVAEVATGRVTLVD